MNFKEFEDLSNIDENMSLEEWLEKAIPLVEYVKPSRYSVEVNYRSKIDEMMDAFAKIALGYVSAALKGDGFHVKHVYDESPIRILVSSRNWDDGEWCGVVNFNPKHEGGSFILSKGFYNKDRRTISIQSSKKCEGNSATDIAKQLREAMHELRDKSDRHTLKLKGVPLKRGPKS